MPGLDLDGLRGFLILLVTMPVPKKNLSAFGFESIGRMCIRMDLLLNVNLDHIRSVQMSIERSNIYDVIQLIVFAGVIMFIIYVHRMIIASLAESAIEVAFVWSSQQTQTLQPG